MISYTREKNKLLEQWNQWQDSFRRASHLERLEVLEKSSTKVFPEESKKLNKREWDCLALVIEGYSNAEIGRELGISARTVECHIAAIKFKLKLKNKREIIQKYNIVPWGKVFELFLQIKNRKYKGEVSI